MKYNLTLIRQLFFVPKLIELVGIYESIKLNIIIDYIKKLSNKIFFNV